MTRYQEMNVNSGLGHDITPAHSDFHLLLFLLLLTLHHGHHLSSCVSSYLHHTQTKSQQLKTETDRKHVLSAKLSQTNLRSAGVVSEAGERGRTRGQRKQPQCVLSVCSTFSSMSSVFRGPAGVDLMNVCCF